MSPSDAVSEPLGVPGAETPGQPACDFRPSKPPWPSQMCATCGDWRENHAPLPSCPTHAVCPPCREGWGHWTGSEYVPTLESTRSARSGRPVAHTEKGERR